MNLPTNTNYQGNEGVAITPKNTYNPDTAYKNLANLNASGSSPFTPTTAPTVSTNKNAYTPATEYQNLARLNSTTDSPFTPSLEADPNSPEGQRAEQASILRYGNLVNNGQGIPSETPFLGETTPGGSAPLPSGYGKFKSPQTISDNGENLSWGTPKTPVLRTTSGGDIQGQYIEDSSDPNLLVKTDRGDQPLIDAAMKMGRPGNMWQIDHIMPLELGGADTPQNRQMLTSEQNDKKTRAQAVPYTLYAHGDITLSQARDMAMKWKDRDVTDIPQPNGVGLVSDVEGGKTGIEIARDAAARWAAPKIPTLKEKIGTIPTLAKDFGKGFLPDSVREFMKGGASGLSLGFVPYEQGENESGIAGVSGKVGMLVGGVASFLLGGELIDGALLLGGLAKGAIGARRVVAAGEAAKAGFQSAKAIDTTANITFKSLNKAPGYLQNVLTPAALKQSGKFAVTSAVVGQGSQFVQNHFNPYTISGQAYQKDEENLMGNIFKDLAIGAVSGIGSPTIKGTAYATMLPLTLTYLANPDDPMDALINGVSFGAMHAMGAAKTKGYNDIEMFGGKSGGNKATEAFEQTVNKAAYASLNHYAPDVMKGFKPGDKIPENVIQNAKDIAIQNVWKQFFFDKPVTGEQQSKTLDTFKSFSEGLDTKLNNLKPVAKLPLFQKLSPSARKAKTAEERAQSEDITKEFGKNYQTRNEVKGDTPTEAEGSMDMQTALSEIKRITVAGRQLYKGGLSDELRNKADLDDLLSYGKNNLQGRFDSLVKFANPPIIEDSLKEVGNDFMTKSFANQTKNPNSKFPNGDVALTGAGLSINQPTAEYFFKQKEAGNASPNILLVSRPDTASLWRMKNENIDVKDIKENNYAVDLKPENALQAFGVVWKTAPDGTKTGGKELVPLGWVASNHRLNEATGKGHVAFNKDPLVQEYISSNGQSGMRPIDFHKDQISDAMNENGLRVLVANLDPRATSATIRSEKPFIPVTLNDGNWSYSKDLAGKLSEVKDVNPVSMDIAKFNNAKTAADQSKSIAKMQSKIIRPAADYIPVDTTPASKTNNVTLPKEQTRGLLRETENALNVKNPEQLKYSFDVVFGIKLSDKQAADIFNKRNEMTVNETIQLLVDAVNADNASLLTKLKLNFAKTYLESGSLQFTEAGKALPHMLVVGGLKGEQAVRQNENIAKLTASKPEIAPKHAEDGMIRGVNAPETNVNPKVEESITPAVVAAPESKLAPKTYIPSGGIVDKIVGAKVKYGPNVFGGKYTKSGRKLGVPDPKTPWLTPYYKEPVEASGAIKEYPYTTARGDLVGENAIEATNKLESPLYSDIKNGSKNPYLESSIIEARTNPKINSLIREFATNKYYLPGEREKILSTNKLFKSLNDEEKRIFEKVIKEFDDSLISTSSDPSSFQAQNNVNNNTVKRVNVLLDATPVISHILKGVATPFKSKMAENADEFISLAKDRMNNADFGLGRNSSNYDKLYDNEIAKTLAEARNRMQQSPGMDEKTIINTQKYIKNELLRFKENELSRLTPEEKEPSKLDIEPPDYTRENRDPSKDQKGYHGIFITGEKPKGPTYSAKGKESYAPRDEYEDKSTKKLPIGDVDPSTENYFETIQKNLNTEDKTSPAYASAKAQDLAFRKLAGDDYATNPKLKEFLKNFFSKTFFNQISTQGKEITQPKDVIENAAAGDRDAFRKATTEANTKNLTDAEKIKKEEELMQQREQIKKINKKYGMNLKLDDEVPTVHDLTEGEKLIPSIVSEKPMTNVMAVRDIKSLFTSPGGIVSHFVGKNGEKPSIPFNTLIAEAEKADKLSAANTINELNAKAKAKIEKNIQTKEFNDLVKKYKNIEKVIKNTEAPEPYLGEALADIKSSIADKAKALGIENPSANE